MVGWVGVEYHERGTFINLRERDMGRPGRILMPIRMSLFFFLSRNWLEQITIQGTE